jgi:hypothetical protein
MPHLEDFHALHVGCQASEALTATATQANKHGMATCRHTHQTSACAPHFSAAGNSSCAYCVRQACTSTLLWHDCISMSIGL